MAPLAPERRFRLLRGEHGVEPRMDGPPSSADALPRAFVLLHRPLSAVWGAVPLWCGGRPDRRCHPPRHQGGIAQGRQDSLRDLLHTWRMPLVGFGVGFGIVVVTYFFMAVTWVDLATTDHVRLDATRRIPDSLSCAAASARPICLLSGKPDGVTSGDGGQPTHRMCRLRISRCDVYLCSGSWPVPAWNQFERS